MNSQCVFRLAGVGSKMKSLPCDNTLSYEMSFNDFRFHEELSLLFDHDNRTLPKKTRERQANIMQKVLKKHHMQSHGLLSVATSF